jgi:hypothetical protein
MTIRPGIIEAKFIRSRTSTSYTKLWKYIDEPTRLLVLNRVSLVLNEIPILCFYSTNATGWLLTTETLFIFLDNKTKTLKLTDIERVEMKDILDGASTKMESTSIQLFTGDELINLKTEVRSWPIIFMIFRFVIQKVTG